MAAVVFIGKLFIVLTFVFSGLLSAKEAIKLEKFNIPGLSDQEPATAFLQDSLGRLWIATQQNILVYDGEEIERFDSYPLDDPSFKQRTRATDIIEFDSSIWAATRDGITQFPFDGSRLFHKHIRNSPHSLMRGEVWSSYIDSKNRLWFGSYYGISVYDENKKTFINYPFHRDETFNRVNKLATAICMAEFNNAFYVVSSSGSILRFDDGNFSLETKIDASQVFQCKQKNDFLWLATDKGLYKYHPQKKQLINTTPNRLVFSFVHRSDGEIIYTTDRATFDSETGEQRSVIQPTLKSFRALEGFSTLYLDREETLWASNNEDGGIFHFSPSAHKFKTIPLSNEFGSLKINKVNLHDGALWIASNQGIFELDKQPKITLEENTNFKSNKIASGDFSFIEISPQYVYALSSDQIIKINRQNTTDLTSINIPQIKALGLKPTSMVLDKNETLWIALSGFDLSRLVKLEHEEQRVKEYDSNDPMFLRAFDWIAASTNPDRSQLFIDVAYNFPRIFDVDSETFVKFKPDYGLPAYTRAISKESNRQWSYHDDYLLTQFEWPLPEDLSTFDVTSIKTPVKGIQCIASDGKTYWMIQNTGNLWRWNKGLNNQQQSQLIKYSQYDGLPLSGLDEHTCLYDSNSHQIILSGGGRIYLANTVEINKNNVLPLNYLSSVTVNENQLSSFTSKLKIKEGDNLTLTARNSSFVAPANNLWQWRLETEGRSTLQGNNSTVNIANIGAGAYKLRINSTNNDHVWGKELYIEIDVLPPFWRSGIAFILYLFCVIALFALYAIWSSWQRAKLNRLVEEKTSEISELLSQKERLFTGISHEFRTPITLILAGVEKLKSEQSLYIQEISTRLRFNARQLMRLVEQLLEYSLQGVITDNKQNHSLNVSQASEAIVLAMKELAEQSKIQLTLDIQPDLIAAVSYEAYEKILFNLLTNAVKYNRPDGSICLALRESRNQTISLSVTDSGIGISQENLPRIFEPLFRAEHDYEAKPNTKNGPIQGTGIGLALVKELVEKYDGTISVKSEEGKGSEFDIVLKKVDLKKLGATKSEELDVLGQDFIGHCFKEVNESADADLYTESINNKNESVLNENKLESIDIEKQLALIVEDNPELCMHIADALNEEFETLVAHNGLLGLEMAQRVVPDIIISDIMMPKLDGYKMLEQIRANEITSHIPVILLTAKTDAQSRIKGWSESADEYMTKPFSMEELQLRVQSLLSIRNLLKQKYSQQIIEDVSQSKIGTNENASRQETSSKPTTLNKEQQFIERLKGVLDKHYESPDFRVPSLADAIHLSERQLHRKIKAITQQSTSDFIRIYRLLRAKEKLDAGMSVNEAAFGSGFNSLSYFSRCFKSYFGHSPSEQFESSLDKK